MSGRGQEVMTTADLEQLPEYLSIQQAAHAVMMGERIIRKAIHEGKLPAFIPRGREPINAGPGQGYRIHRDALARWYFGGQG